MFRTTLPRNQAESDSRTDTHLTQMLMPRKNYPIQNLVGVKARTAKRLSLVRGSEVLNAVETDSGITVIPARLFVFDARGVL
jgi:hypothetical protein